MAVVTVTKHGETLRDFPRDTFSALTIFNNECRALEESGWTYLFDQEGKALYGCTQHHEGAVCAIVATEKDS